MRFAGWANILNTSQEPLTVRRVTDNSPETPGTSDPRPDSGNNGSSEPEPDSGDTPTPDESGTREPELGWLRGLATRVKVQFEKDRRLLALSLLLGLVVLFGTGAVWYALSGNAPLVGTVMGAILLLTFPMWPLIKGKGGDDEKLWTPLMLLILPAAVLLVALIALAIWAYVNSRPVDLTHEFKLTPSGPFKEGMTVSAEAHVDHPKSRLFITFAAPQYDEAQPVCAASSRLEVSLASGVGMSKEQSGKADEEFVFEMGPNRKDILLAIRMTAEPNCELDLSVKSARVDE